MRDVVTSPPGDPDDDLCARAAWLYYGAGMTQGDVARRLSIASVKAHRLIARANRLGLVRVTIDAPISSCMELEKALKTKFGLDQCVVAPKIDDDPIHLRSLGRAGGQFLQRQIESGAHAAIGVGHGRTLAACVANLPRMHAPNLSLVSLLGGMTRRYVTTPFDVIHRLAERTSAAAYVLPLPFLANSIEDRSILMEQRGVADVFALGVASSLRSSGTVRSTTVPLFCLRDWLSRMTLPKLAARARSVNCSGTCSPQMVASLTVESPLALFPCRPPTWRAVPRSPSPAADRKSRRSTPCW